MNGVHVTSHAISRYRERVEAVPEAEVRRRLSSPTIIKAAEIGAHCVRLAGGQRVVIEDGVVTTVLPSDNFKRQIARRGLGRFGRTDRWMRESGE